MNGWVKLHRCTLNKAIWQNQNLWRVFCWCLMRATHKEIEQMVGRKKVLLKPGQLVYGRLKASQEIGLKPSTVNDCIDRLKTNSTIDTTPTAKYSIITLINWALYQSEELLSDTTPTAKPTQLRHKQEDKKIKKDIYSENVALSEEEYQKLVEQFGDADTLKRIANLSYYKGSTGKKYASDYMTILNWARKEEKPKPTNSDKGRIIC